MQFSDDEEIEPTAGAGGGGAGRGAGGGAGRGVGGGSDTLGAKAGAYDAMCTEDAIVLTRDKAPFPTTVGGTLVRPQKSRVTEAEEMAYYEKRYQQRVRLVELHDN